MLTPLVAKNLAAFESIRHGFFTRQGGRSEGIYASLNCGLGSKDNQDNVIENRRRVAEHLGAGHGHVVTLYQEHGRTALTVSAPLERANLPKADAVVTTMPGLAIGVLTADCTPVLFADAGAKVVAAAHAGWRGALGGIVESTINEMMRHGADRQRIRAAVGPCITQAAYEVGDEFASNFVSLEATNSQFFNRPLTGAKLHFDLPGYVAHRLTQAGLEHVELCAPCTLGNESLFFSYRRTSQRQEPDYGRQISAIVVT